MLQKIGLNRKGNQTKKTPESRLVHIIPQSIHMDPEPIVDMLCAGDNRRQPSSRQLDFSQRRLSPREKRTSDFARDFLNPGPNHMRRLQRSRRTCRTARRANPSRSSPASNAMLSEPSPQRKPYWPGAAAATDKSRRPGIFRWSAIKRSVQRLKLRASEKPADARTVPRRAPSP